MTRVLLRAKAAVTSGLEVHPELRYTQGGAALAGFTVAVSHRSKHNGEWQDVNGRVLPMHGVAFGRRNAADTLKKGMRVFVAGKLIQRSFEVEGQKRTTIEVQVQHLGPDLQFATAQVEKATTEAKAS